MIQTLSDGELTLFLVGLSTSVSDKPDYLLQLGDGKIP